MQELETLVLLCRRSTTKWCFISHCHGDIILNLKQIFYNSPRCYLVRSPETTEAKKGRDANFNILFIYFKTKHFVWNKQICKNLKFRCYSVRGQQTTEDSSWPTDWLTEHWWLLWSILPVTTHSRWNKWFLRYFATIA